MNYLPTGIVAAVIALVAFSLMFWAWRGRARRDLAYLPTGPDLKGALIVEMARVYYVATTRFGEPLERIALPGLKYRGYSTVEVLSDGVRVRVDGEQPIEIPRETIAGAAQAQMRIDKVVERGGLALLVWRSNDTILESSFRFADAPEQQRFMTAVDAIANPDLHQSLNTEESS